MLVYDDSLKNRQKQNNVKHEQYMDFISVDSFILLAFAVGLFSALSLPLGALTTLFWTPSDRAIAWLMAFGAGALLSAVTIDLFSPAIFKGLFFEVAVGAIIGSLFYLTLNQQLNQKGGFLRKTATTLQHFRNHQKKPYQPLENSLARLTIFNALPIEQQDALFAALTLKHVSQNQIIYHPGDLANAFYIVQQGHVKLRDPQHDLKTVSQLSALDTFGHMAFLSGFEHTFLAQAVDDVTLWVMSKDDFNRVLSVTPQLVPIISHYLMHHPEPNQYLTERHPSSIKKNQAHRAFIVSALNHQARLPLGLETANTLKLALTRLKNSQRLSLFSACPTSAHPIIASQLKFRKLKAGYTLFSRKSDADRLYLLESGEVELINPLKTNTHNTSLKPGDFFGSMAFLLGGQHVSTALAKTNITFWVLEKPDFINLIHQIPALRNTLQSYLKDQSVQTYLTQAQKLSQSKAQTWVNQTIKKQMLGQQPTLTRFMYPTSQHTVAYLAIWLGLFLDGIPESLMIGAHLSEGQMLSVSLIAALFISNYPEALSSSASMKEQGIPFSKILFAWTFLMVLTGVGAGLGSYWLHHTSPETTALISGIAAGAMLSVISETMLPEAYAKGGSVIGFITLIGFLTAVLFKVFDATI